MVEKYLVELPEFNEKEKNLLEAVQTCLIEDASVEELQKLFLKDREDAKLLLQVKEDLADKIGGLASLGSSERVKARKEVEKFVEGLEGLEHEKELIDRLTSELVGLGKLDELMKDDNLEEIMVNGVHKPVYVFHSEKQMLKTNLVISSRKEIMALAKKMKNRTGEEDLFLDFRLPDGSRVNLTNPPASLSPTITIRKFSSPTLQLVDLVRLGTLNSEIAAFLWVCVEGLKVRPMNMIVTGGSSSGKTTTLNALTSLIRKGSRIVSVEDTLELDTERRDNWVQLETVFGKAEMKDLVKNSLRMRPDRIVVGEVRGEEAKSLFTAMDVGCAGSMGTLHSNNVREALTRLRSPPMNVPEQMIPLLDVIVVQHRFDWPGRGIIRRVTQISEVRRSGDGTAVNELFKWNKKEEKFKSEYLSSEILDEIAFGTGKSREEIMDEIDLRKNIIKWAIDEGKDFRKVVEKFYSDRSSLLEEINRSF